MIDKYQKYYTLALTLTFSVPGLLLFQFACLFLYGWGVSDGAEPALFLELIANYGQYFIAIYFVTCLTFAIIMKNKLNKLKNNK